VYGNGLYAHNLPWNDSRLVMVRKAAGETKRAYTQTGQWHMQYFSAGQMLRGPRRESILTLYFAAQ